MVESIEQVVVSSTDTEAMSRLTEREREILKLIFDGRCSSEVAYALSVSKRTVDFHLAKAYMKMGVSNRFQAFKRAVDLGIISS